MKKCFSLLRFLFVLTIFIPMIYYTSMKVEGVADFKYKDWQFNNDFTKVTIDGKTFDNYIIVWRQNDLVHIHNVWSDYLVFPAKYKDITPEQYADKVKGMAEAYINTIYAGFPKTELISVNGIEWQDTEFKDDYILVFKFAFISEVKIEDYIESNVLAFLNDKKNNGYAQWVLGDGLTIEQAKQEKPLELLPLKVAKYEVYRSYEEMARDGITATNIMLRLREIAECKNIQEFNKAKATSESVAYSSAPVLAKKSVILFLNNRQMTITKGNESQLLSLNVAPVAPNGNTLVPIRSITESFGATVEWFGDTREILITKGDTTIKLQLDSDIAVVNGKQLKMLEAAQAINNRTVIPLRFVAENMGYEVKWEETTKKITITE